MMVHDLDGCAPAPLAHYLKALGILRLIAEQTDPQARGWWEGERFRLATRLDRAQIEAFFLEQYEPTPIVSPWNKGSGFFYAHDPGVTPIETAGALRANRLKLGLKAARAQLDDLIEADNAVRAIKAEATDKNLTTTEKKNLKQSSEYKERLAEAERLFRQLKAELIPRIRFAWRGPHREWMDAAMVLGDDSTPKFPALLGTGGNDGRLDFTNNFLQRLNDIFVFSTASGKPRLEAGDWFSAALWGTPSRNCQTGSAVGQYLPGMAGGANSTNAPSGDSLLNPVDFVLMLEGTILFRGHTTRRLGNNERTRAAAPFAVNSRGTGYFSAAETDESTRGEQWMPLWSQPLTLIELKHLLAEGRVQLGTRCAVETLDFARAVARLGSARGISAFQRYGYIQRNGQSNLAIPLGRFRVPEHSSHQLSCIDDLDVWYAHLCREARAKHAPSRLTLTARRLSDSLFAVTQHPKEKPRWQTVLMSLADVESVLRTGTGMKAGPVPRLRPEWINAADDGSAEFRLAVACALQARGFRRDGIPVDPVRRHWLPLEGNRFASAAKGSQNALQKNPEVVLTGRGGVEDAIFLVQRRLVEAGQRGERRLPLVAAKKAAAHPADLAKLLAAEVDIDRTMRLARALMAVAPRQWASTPCPCELPTADSYPDDAWLAVRLALLPWPLPDGRQIGTDISIVRRLESGDGATAVKSALQRLRAAGIRATVRAAAVSPRTARLWAAALAFPITRNTAAGFLRRLNPNSTKEKTS